MIRTFLLLLSLALAPFCFGQPVFGITGFAESTAGIQHQELIESRPKEVLFGIHIMDGKVYFDIGSREWFDRIFSQAGDGVTADLVSRDALECGVRSPREATWYRGTVLKPMLQATLKQRVQVTNSGTVTVLLGDIPPQLKGKELEGNLVIVRNHEVSFYTNFLNLDRSLWELLDMGLYTDSLLQVESSGMRRDNNFFYSRRLTLTIPFAKRSAALSPADIRPLYDSLRLQGSVVKKVAVRAFSSVEGKLAANLALQRQRGQSIVAAIQSFQKEAIRTEVSSGENWVEFVKALDKSPFSYLSNLSKKEVKNRLERKTLIDSLEGLLSAQRKAIVTIYLDTRSGASGTDLAGSFRKAIGERRIADASALQQEIFKRVADRALPDSYLEGLQIPFEKPFTRLLNDQQVYRLLLGAISEDDALAELLKVAALQPANGKVQYNIAALQLSLWQFNEKAVNKDSLRFRINSLKDLGIASPLIARMQINYRILQCEILMKAGNYAEKDRVLSEIREKYISRNLSDRDLLSLGKYFSMYAQYEWADKIIAPRMEQLDVSADLLFFYLNLAFFTGHEFDTDPAIKRMLLNAISIDNERFCHFFNASDRDGISMQLLLDPFWKGLYCENCAGPKVRQL
jgi:hypothetical protein